MDTRAHQQAARMTISGAPVLRYAGRAVLPEFGIPKALWLRENEPDAYARAAVICDCLDWLNFRLTRRWGCGQKRWWYRARWTTTRPQLA